MTERSFSAVRRGVALAAPPPSGQVLNGAFRRVVAGLVLGVPLAVGAGRLLSAQLYGVRFWAPVALSVAMVSLAVCAFCAAIIPALRAASISPLHALRTE